MSKVPTVELLVLRLTLSCQSKLTLALELDPWCAFLQR